VTPSWNHSPRASRSEYIRNYLPNNSASSGKDKTNSHKFMTAQRASNTATFFTKINDPALYASFLAVIDSSFGAPKTRTLSLSREMLNSSVFTLSTGREGEKHVHAKIFDAAV
jgi:hypothetical protein